MSAEQMWRAVARRLRECATGDDGGSAIIEFVIDIPFALPTVVDSSRLDLERRVLDRDGEVLRHAFPHSHQHVHGVPVVETPLLHHDVRAQRGQTGGDRAGVNVVHVHDVGQRADVLAHVLQV